MATNRIRVARVEGEFLIDKSGNANGRGAYVCFGCVDTAVKKRAFNRSFKTELPKSIYDELLALVDKK